MKYVMYVAHYSKKTSIHLLLLQGSEARHKVHWAEEKIKVLKLFHCVPVCVPVLT